MTDKGGHVILQILKGGFTSQGLVPRACCVKILDLSSCLVPSFSIKSEHTSDSLVVLENLPRLWIPVYRRGNECPRKLVYANVN